MTTKPDKWLMLKITPKGGQEPTYKVFATWFGSYLAGAGWRLNSGVESARVDGEHYVFTGYSGSEYHCHVGAYGTTGYGSSVLNGLIENTKQDVEVQIMDEGTDWLSLQYS
jgi:hypothetical protein